jgi:hypothetical protein
MPLAKLVFRPGFNREVTSYTNEGGWIDGDKVRFRNGFPETIGGWVRQTQSSFLGRCRALINWTTLNGTNLIGVGTHLKYYVNRGGINYDITPLRLTTSPGAVTFSATNGSTELIVFHNGHGARVGDFVTFSGAVSLGGAVTASVLNSEHQISSVINSNSYTIQLNTPANANDINSGGSNVVARYQIHVGLPITFRGNGWGSGSWGVNGWGLPSNNLVDGEELRIWSHTTYGEDLIINPRGGGLYYWKFSNGFTNNRAVLISSMPGATQVPAACNIVRLSERDRHVLAFGCTPLGGGDLDPLLIRFSSQENFLDWNPTTTNTAGDLRISSGNQIVAVEQTSQQMLVLTESSAHVLQFIGPPFTFGVREIASGLSIAGPNAVVSANGVIYWMGLGEFYVYDGTVRQIPCSVKEYVFDQTFDIGLRDVVYAAHNASFSEVWWFYPDKEFGDCSRYVVYNYEQGLWYYGTMQRSAWVDRGISPKPIAAGFDGHLYNHEIEASDGSQNPPVGISSFIQSSFLNLGEGDHFMFVSRIIPDITFRNSKNSSPNVTLTITAKNFPGSSSFGNQFGQVLREVALPVEEFTDQIFVRLRGRSMALRIESNTPNTAWRLGSPRVEVRTDGRK